MAVKKTANSTKAKAKDTPAPKKAVGVKAAGAAKKGATPEQASPKKKAAHAPVKLSPAQADLLGRVHGAGESGYPGAKKAEQRTLDALLERKLIKRGARNKESGQHTYQVSIAGKKHVESGPAADAPASPVAPTPSAPPTGGS